MTRTLGGLPLAALPGLAAFAAFAACGERAPGPDTPAATVRDSSGVSVVESARPLLVGEDAWRVDPGPVLEIGAVDDEPAYWFAEVAGAVLLPDGGVAVADGVAGEVRFFGPGGAFRRSFGRPGEGPGEFTGLSAIGPGPEGGVWAWDFSLRRITLLDADGASVSQTAVGPEPAALHPVGMLPDGSLVLKQLWGFRRVAEVTSTGVRRDSVAFVRFGRAGEGPDTVGLFPGRELYIGEEDGRGVMHTLPFGRNAVGTVREGRVVVGTQDAFELLELGPDGRVLRIVRIPSRRSDLPAGEAARVVDERVRAVPPDERPALRRSLEALPTPDRKPAYGGVLADGAGNLWVSAWAPGPDPPRRWTVLDVEGRWLTEVELPAGFQLLQVEDDRAVGIVRDAMDVERVAVLRLEKPGAGEPGR